MSRCLWRTITRLPHKGAAGGVFRQSSSRSPEELRRNQGSFAHNRLSLLEMSLDRDTGGGGSDVLESVTAQNGSERINRAIIELEQLRESI